MNRPSVVPGVLFTALAALAHTPALAAAQEGPGATDFFVTWGFRQVEHALGEDGRELTLYRPEGVLRPQVELALLSDEGGSVTSAVLRVDRTLFANDRSVARELVASFVEDAVPYEDRPETAGLRSMIRSDDVRLRRGETERSRGCCALPPVPARDVAAVAVVDGTRPYALVRLEESSVRFREGATPMGAPALLITVSGPDRPEQVVEAVFEAARYGDAAWLVDLCRAGIDTDGDVDAICGMRTDAEDWGAFVRAFRSGTVAGPTQIEDGRARVPFRFGPDGRRDEVMELEWVEGRWVLVSF